MYKHHQFFYWLTRWNKWLINVWSLYIIAISISWAVPITFRFEGEITRVDSPLSEHFYAGKKFSFSYTFDSQAADREVYGKIPGVFSYDEAISKMTFTSGAYTAFANNGSIVLDLQDGQYTYNHSLDAVLGAKIGHFVPNKIRSSWRISYNAHWHFIPEIDEDGPPEHPRFVPDISLKDYCGVACSYYDADGNIVFDHRIGLTDYPLNPAIPLYDSNGNLLPTVGNNGHFYFTFKNEQGQSTWIVGRLISGNVIPDPIDKALVAYWPLHDGEGTTAFDYSGNKQDGEIHNGPTWKDNVLYFHGDDDYIDAGYLDVPGEALTLTAWVKSEDFANCRYNGCRIITKSAHTSNPAQYWIISTVLINNETHLRFSLKTNGETSHLYATGDNLKENEWMHVAAVYDGSHMFLYKNGVEVGSLPKSGPIDTNHTIPVWIGGNAYYNYSRPWKGNIANVRIFQKALTADEVKVIRDEDRTSFHD